MFSNEPSYWQDYCRKSRMKQLILFSLAALCWACQSAQRDNKRKTDTLPQAPPQEVNTDSLVVPGKAIGHITLNTDAGPVMEIMGKPDSGDAAMGKAVSMWISGKNLTAIYTERNMGVDDTSRIKQIRSTYPGFVTNDHIGVGVTLKDIEQRMPVARLGEYTEGKDTFALYTTREGISFEVNREQQCTGIIVHPAGSDPTSVYLPFHSNLRK